MGLIPGKRTSLCFFSSVTTSFSLHITMAWRCSGSTNLELCMQLKSNGIIKTAKVEAAFISTDRKHFCPPDVQKHAYEDRPVRHGHVHMSAPHIYASTLETLDLFEGAKFLCIGSGSGYFSTLVGH